MAGGIVARLRNRCRKETNKKVRPFRRSRAEIRNTTNEATRGRACGAREAARPHTPFSGRIAPCIVSAAVDFHELDASQMRIVFWYNRYALCAMPTHNSQQNTDY
ncbi:hypothetical protein EVAR_94447_1 [Eumeta japonica]|uniref:Uncharacterized protein n=1 Tax=Eumeta variegata TaxID=151549 RepID=A0A4C1ZPH6_EUMVA|nr:hypothetical protein EVAR_94447_1 [Eumeta japonica]